VLQATWLLQLLPSWQQLEWNDHDEQFAAAAVARMVALLAGLVQANGMLNVDSLVFAVVDQAVVIKLW
jgi:hypothetical protein